MCRRGAALGLLVQARLSVQSLCYACLKMVMRAFREVVFLALAAVAVLAFSATALVLTWLFLYWLDPTLVDPELPIER